MQNIQIIFLGFLGAMVFHFIQIRFFPTANAVESKIISASAFNLVDSQGKLRGQFGFAKEGPPGFWLMDEKGTSRLAMGLYTDGTAHLGLQDRQGQSPGLAEVTTDMARAVCNAPAGQHCPSGRPSPAKADQTLL